MMWKKFWKGRYSIIRLLQRTQREAGAPISAKFFCSLTEPVYKTGQKKAMALTGSDARMNGCEMPVVINSGSGNQGMTASLPVIVYAEDMKVSRKCFAGAGGF